MHKIKYTSYRQGAIIEVEIEDSTWEQLEKDYHEVEALCKRHGINTARTVCSCCVDNAEITTCGILDCLHP